MRRYVAIGDSTTEGLDDPDGAGGYRGWADRLAEHVAAVHEGLEYANLAVRGRCAREIKEEQLDAAVALRPDVATVVAGMNDLLRVRFDARAIAADVGEMQRALVDRGAVVMTMSLPDLSPRLTPPPFARRLAGRTAALNDELRRVTAASGARLLDLAAIPHATDPRLWSGDRLHANSAGHARVAAGFAQLLDLPGTDDAWRAPFAQPHAPTWRETLADHARWGRDHLAPWLWRRARGRRAGDAVTAKRPVLAPVITP